MTRIKICGITRVQDIQCAAQSGVDAIGLVFYEPSPRFVGIEHAINLIKALPPFITTVGLFVNAEPAYIHQVINNVPLDILQFHGDETPAYCEQFNKPYLKAVRVKVGVDLLQWADDFRSARGLLLDAHVEGLQGGTGETFDWGLIPKQIALPIILSGGLDTRNVGSAIRQVKPYAVDVSSGVEISKGLKDSMKITSFINEVKRTDV